MPYPGWVSTTWAYITRDGLPIAESESDADRTKMPGGAHPQLEITIDESRVRQYTDRRMAAGVFLVPGERFGEHNIETWRSLQK